MIGEVKVNVPKRSKKNKEEVEVPKKKEIHPGFLQMHTMISLTDDYTLDNSQRSLWYTSNHSENQSLTQGCLIFGGINEKKRISNDLWLIEIDEAANKKEVFNDKGDYLYKQSANKIYIKIRKVKAMGQPPVPRYSHAACLFKKRYMAIYGGRNDYLMSETSKFMLNDLHLYDISNFLIFNLSLENNTWTLIAMYGCVFEGRA